MPIEPIVLGVKDAADFIGLSRSRLYELIAEQKIEARKLGSRTVSSRQPPRLRRCRAAPPVRMIGGLPLDAATIRKVVAAARLLDSDKPGEVAAAILAFKRLTDGATVADVLEQVLTPRPVRLAPERPVWDIRTDPLCPWRNTARTIAGHRKKLSDREYDFILQMAAQRGRPTPRQQAWLDALAASVDLREAA